MSTKLLMAASAAFMAVLGLAATFLPQEIIVSLGGGTGRTLPLVVQVLGALYLGFAMLNWMAKESLIGGIYSRPVSMGNFLHFAIAAITMVKAVAGAERMVSIGVLACTLTYVVFAVAFGAVVFGRAGAAK